jgi:hypothetical protein
MSALLFVTMNLFTDWFDGTMISILLKNRLDCLEDTTARYVCPVKRLWPLLEETFVLPRGSYSLG